MPWLPYFSGCSLMKDKILLNDLIQPNECRSDILEGIVCTDKDINFDCLIEEYEVNNVASEYWFNSPNDRIYIFYSGIIFYLYS